MASVSASSKSSSSIMSSSKSSSFFCSSGVGDALCHLSCSETRLKKVCSDLFFGPSKLSCWGLRDFSGDDFGDEVAEIVSRLILLALELRVFPACELGALNAAIVCAAGRLSREVVTTVVDASFSEAMDVERLCRLVGRGFVDIARMAYHYRVCELQYVHDKEYSQKAQYVENDICVGK